MILTNDELKKRIQGQPFADVLTEVDVGSHLVAMLLLYQVAISILYLRDRQRLEVRTSRLLSF